MSPLTHSPISDDEAFALAERVVAIGRRATFTQNEQMALCLWIVAQRPQEPGEFTVTIHGAVPFDQMKPGTQTALRHLIERARDAACAVLRGEDLGENLVDPDKSNEDLKQPFDQEFPR
jgi:hypothetical protein